MCDIFTYVDYREFLRAALQQTKAKSRRFSFRYVARSLGLSSSAFFALVLQGKRKLPEKLILPVARLFKLGKKETEYFELLVRYEHARAQQEKQYHFEKLTRFLDQKARTVTPDRYRFYDKWYYAVILEIIDYHGFRDDYTELAKLVVPPISPKEAQRAVEVLEKLGFVRKNPQGVYEKAEPVITAGDQWQSAAIHALQATFIDLGKEALDRFARDDRDISNLTLSVSAQTFGVMKDKLRAMRAELLGLAKADANAIMVVQVNIQAFPVSRPEEDDKP
jgi:uncharacterized protein (TIGR02147 family)